ncbi:acyl-CoA dehydrogenase family protein [Rhodococcus sp. UFZ-B548]|uniref:acyl-CoA dehydrogenase family protein n=1 Tax=Rhodococcus sp. UFZ-B548 TaxID=2742212 RepID=UPI0015F73E42|nr:acyl-CoA dehydrogenase family protein [Rhodococcus sp. UFZ-B548]
MKSKLEVLEQVSLSIDGRAEALDRGEADTRADITSVGNAGLLELGATDLCQIVTVLEEISGRSLAAGFSLWAQRMAIEYIARAPLQVRQRYLSDLVSGTKIGVTAMAAGLKQVAGLGKVPLIATASEVGISVTGPISWASNVFDSSLIVFPARSEDGQTYIAVVQSDSAGITIHTPPDLLALGGTASTSITFNDVRIREADILSKNLSRFVLSIRPAFLILQTSFCSGITRTALSESAELLTGLGAQFVDDYKLLAARYDTLRSDLYRYAGEPDSAKVRDLVAMRLEGSNLAVAASRLEAMLRGGAGYAATSATSRRFREAAFLPIQSPSEGQLRWELAKYES